MRDIRSCHWEVQLSSQNKIGGGRTQTLQDSGGVRARGGKPLAIGYQQHAKIPTLPILPIVTAAAQAAGVSSFSAESRAATALNELLD